MSPAPSAAALMKDNPNARVLMEDDPRLPQMPEKPTLTDFFKYRFGPCMHLLQKCPACGEDQPTREDCTRLLAARHLDNRLYPRRPRLLGRNWSSPMSTRR